MKTKKICLIIGVIVIFSFAFVIAINAINADNNANIAHDYSKDEEFTYNIEKEYTNRQSVKNELDNLSTAFENFCNGKTDAECFANLEKYDYYKSVLNGQLAELPKTEVDILAEKQEKLYFLFDCLDDEMTAVETMYKRAAEKAEIKDKYESTKTEYKKGVQIIREYEDGRISIDEALSFFGVTTESFETENTKPEELSIASD